MSYSMATARTGTDYLLLHVACSFARLIFTVNSQRTGEKTRGTKRSGSATFGGHRNQPPSLIAISSPNLYYIFLTYLSCF